MTCLTFGLMPQFSEYGYRSFFSWTYGTNNIKPLYTIWQEQVALGMLPVQQQWENFFNITYNYYAKWGYTYQEVRWWMLRTGQGPQCFRQFPGVGPGALPPYEVWRDWHFTQSMTTGIPNLMSQGDWSAWIPCTKGCAPPGYHEPYLPDWSPDGNVCDPQDSTQWANMLWYGTSPSWTYFYNAILLGIPPPVGNYYATSTWSDAACAGGGFVHAVPPCWRILNPTIKLGKESGNCYGPMGLPIAVMFVLDKLTSKQWAHYFNDRLDAIEAAGDLSVSPYATALRDTLNNFGIGDASLWSLQGKMENAYRSAYNSCRAKGGIQFWGGQFGQILSMIALAVIAQGVMAAISAAIAEAAAEAAALAAATGETSTFAELAATLPDIENAVKIAQTGYKLYSQITSDDPNLLGIASSLVSLGNSTGLSDALVPLDVVDTSSFDFAGFTDVDFSAGESLAMLDLQDAEALTTGAVSDAIAGMATDLGIDTVTLDAAGLGEAVSGNFQDAIDAIVNNLDQYADNPEALWAAMQDAAQGVAPQITDDAIAFIDDNVDLSIDEIMSEDVALANSQDFGPLTVDQLDQTEFMDGIDDVPYDTQIAQEEAFEQAASASISELSDVDLSQILKIGAQIESLLHSATVTPPPPPPPAPAPSPTVTPSPTPSTGGTLTQPPSLPPVRPPSPSPITFTPGTTGTVAPGETPATGGLSPLWMLLTIITSMTGKG